MKANPSHHTSSLGLLFRQYWIYHRRLILISTIGFITGLLLLLYTIHVIIGFRPFTPGEFMMLFIWVFMVSAIACSGSSFPGFRSREKGYSYLLLPVSAENKFLFEASTRIFLFAIVVPLLYWMIFHVEGYLVEMFQPAFTFKPVTFFETFHLPTESENNWMKILVAGQGLLFLTVPFKGSTVFMKHPVLKTAMWSIGILFGHLILYYFISKMDIQIFPNRLTGTIFMTSYVLLINIAMMVMAFINLNNKQI